MGDIGNEGALVFFHFIQFIGHIVQRVGQISHFVRRIDFDRIIQISVCIFFGSGRDALQRNVHHLREDQKND